jgi:hypothetical protein
MDLLIGDSTDAVLRTSMGSIFHPFADTGAAYAGLQILPGRRLCIALDGRFGLTR